MTLAYEQGLIEAHRMIPSCFSFNERGELQRAASGRQPISHDDECPTCGHGDLPRGVTICPTCDAEWPEDEPSVERKDTDTEEEGA